MPAKHVQALSQTSNCTSVPYIHETKKYCKILKDALFGFACLLLLLARRVLNHPLLSHGVSRWGSDRGSTRVSSLHEGMAENHGGRVKKFDQFSGPRGLPVQITFECTLMKWRSFFSDNMQTPRDIL